MTQSLIPPLRYEVLSIFIEHLPARLNYKH